MERREVILLVVGACLAVASSKRDATADEGPTLSVVVHPSNASATADRAALRQIFQTKVTRWQDGERVTPYNLPRQSAPRAAFDRAVLGLSPEESARYWIDRKLRGGAAPPATATDHGAVLRAVAQVRGAIGYVPAGSAGPDVKVIATIHDGKVMPP